MAIAFARAEYISRSNGGNAVRSAAYNARRSIKAERTLETFSFANREAPDHHEVLLPAGADAKFADAAVLWNTTERAERRKDSQVAREVLLALPANHEISHEDRIALARSFALEHFVSKGLAVQIDIHAPHEGDSESEKANHHAHLLITTRRLEGDQFAKLKARDLDPVLKRIGGNPIVTEGDPWGEIWRDHQNRFFAENGLEIRVDATNWYPQPHIGPIRMRTPGSDVLLTAEEVAAVNAEAARDPHLVLETLTQNEATFTKRDVERYLARHIPDEEERTRIRDAVLRHADVIRLFDRRSGRSAGRFTTKAVREQEMDALADALATANGKHATPRRSSCEAALATRSLRPDQRAAFDYTVSAGGLKIIEGRAGTGKSYTLKAIAEAHEKAGFEVAALAPTNAVAQNLKQDGFTRTGTIHSELFHIKNGRQVWTSNTLVIIDEAAMLDSKILGQVMLEARRSGAKVVLAGDDRQLASIERGGLFTELKNRHGCVEISEVTRQQVDWQRQAAMDLSEGRHLEAVETFERNNGITWSKRQEASRTALVDRWREDTAADPDASRFVFAYTNKDVEILNADLRQVRKERGELGEEHVFETKHGPAAFAIGDRIQFTETVKRLGLYNGTAATITGIDPATGAIRARLDGSEAREVEWDVTTFPGFRHGYAGTIYKGQGRTLDHTYLFHSHHWRASASYVALTRQRKSAHIFVARETAADIATLARQISRSSTKHASVAFVTAEEAQALGRRTQAKQNTRASAPTRPRTSGSHTAFGPEAWQRLHEALAPEIVAQVVARHPTVQREREKLHSHIRQAFQDPEAARRMIDELVAQEGYTSAARRILVDPPGALNGATGFFAGKTARCERQRAEEMVGAIASDLERLSEAETRIAKSYRSIIKPIQKLSPQAQTCLGELAGAWDAEERLAIWKRIRNDRAGAELEAMHRDHPRTHKFEEHMLPPEARTGLNEAKKVLDVIRATRQTFHEEHIRSLHEPVRQRRGRTM